MDLPEIRRVAAEDMEVNYLRIKKEVWELVKNELEKMPKPEAEDKGKGKRKNASKREVKSELWKFLNDKRTPSM